MARWHSLAFAVAAFTYASTTNGEISLSTDIEGGSLASYSVAGDRIRLVGAETWTEFPDQYRWVHFKASGVQGRTPRFEIGSELNAFLGDLNRHRFVYSTDGKTWDFFDNNRLSGPRFSFSNNVTFDTDEVLVAYSTPYPVSRTIDYVQRAANLWFVSPTHSSSDNLILDRVESLPLFGFRITNPLSRLEKQKVILVGGNHSGEMGGSFALEGMLDFLTGDDPIAKGLRNSADFYVYPQADPLGRREGFYRGNSQNAAIDHNRIWDALTTGFDGEMKEIPILAQAMRDDTESNVEYAFDFHGFFDSGPNFLYGDTRSLNNRFTSKLLELDPFLETLEDNRTEPTGILEFWWKTPEGVNANYSYTPEFSPNMMADELIDTGKNFGIALADVIGTPYTIDRTEIDRLTSVMIGGTTDLSYDFNRDGAVNFADREFYVENAWGTRFGDANVDGTFDSSDLVEVFQAAEYEDDIAANSTWTTGDWNGDFEFTTRDLIAAFRVRDAFGATVVPEPSFSLSRIGLLSYLLATFSWQRRSQ